ncbi:MAG: deoxyribonuclease V [Chloroflexota bacterium]
MRLRQLHDWQVSIARAREIQIQFAGQLVLTGSPEGVRCVAGTDVSVISQLGLARAAVVVLDYPTLTVVDSVLVEAKPEFPYVPGLLSFREIPLLIQAFERLRVEPDLVMVDGQGYAHPRRFGLASHLGLLLDRPTIGCAKSRLCGSHDGLGEQSGEWCSLVDGDEVVGAVVRTRTGSKPLYVSCGHRIGLPSAVQWVLDCCRGYRLPEPTRLSHLASIGRLVATTG